MSPYDRRSFLKRSLVSAAALSLSPHAFISALNLLREAEPRMREKEAFVIRGGSDTFPRAFAAKLRENIQYAAVAKRIEQDDREARVIYERAGEHSVLHADRIVFAIPFSVLRQVEFAPAISREKQRAITELSNTSVVRVFLQTRKRFWLDENLNGAATTDLPLMTAYDKAFYLPGVRGMLEAYVAGERARGLTAMTDADRISFTLSQMEKSTRRFELILKVARRSAGTQNRFRAALMRGSSQVK